MILIYLARQNLPYLARIDSTLQRKKESQLDSVAGFPATTPHSETRSCSQLRTAK